MECIYISGPYTADSIEERDENIRKANELAQIFAEEGWAVYCPHTQSQNWEYETGLSHEDFLERDFEWIDRSDALGMVEGWEDSDGAVREHERAQRLGRPIYYQETNEWECPVGIDFPADVHRYKREEAEVIISKQMSYGPGNINAFGDFGVLVRFSDKFERLKNLYTNDQADNRFESVDDSWLDGSNYGTIARMYRNGDWPKEGE